MRAPLWLALAFVPLAHSADPGEVRIRSAAYTPRAPVISAEANLVESAVTVYDARGNPAGGFTAADFLLSDNGKAQPVSFFSELRSAQGSGPGAAAGGGSATLAVRPRSVALFFDDLHLSGAGLQRSIEAAQKLVTSGLPAGERLGLFTDSGTVTVDFTSDTAALLGALVKIKPHNDPGDRGMTVCPTLTPYTAFLIAERIEMQVRERAVAEVMGCDKISHEVAESKVQDIAESVWENSRQRSVTALDVLKLLVAHLAKQDGERILILVSQGFADDGRMRSEKSAIFDDALRGHVVINSLGVGEIGLSYSQLILFSAMADAAAASGGRLVKNTNDLTGALSGLAAEPAVSYLLGFQAGNPDGKYHLLKIRLAGRDKFRVESRPGYFASLPVQQAGSVQERIDRAVLSHELLRDVPAVVRVTPAAGGIQVVVDIDAKGIRFAGQGGVHLQQLTFVTVIQDEQGGFVAGKQAVMDLRLKPATLAHMRETGIHAVESFALRPGIYKVREVVRELVQDRMSASDTAVTLR